MNDPAYKIDDPHPGMGSLEQIEQWEYRQFAKKERLADTERLSMLAKRLIMGTNECDHLLTEAEDVAEAYLAAKAEVVTLTKAVEALLKEGQLMRDALETFGSYSQGWDFSSHRVREHLKTCTCQK